ncbi:MAG: DUF2304 domain-containing protein [Gemmatimonadetes bacterium]|nr:DUF2304 domain-containing protein [Gemmatimonadota bacterium]
MNRVQLVSILGSLGLLAMILELIRRGKLAEEYSLLWIATGAVLLLLSLWRGLLDLFAAAVGIFYPPSGLFLVGFIFVLLLILHFSVIVSRLSRQNRELAQDVALLREKLERMTRTDDGKTRGEE